MHGPGGIGEGRWTRRGGSTPRRISRFRSFKTFMTFRKFRAIRTVRTFRTDVRGATAVEFGLIALPFLATLCAIFELGYANFQNEMLANAVNGAARAMLTGSLQTANVTTAKQFVSNYLCPSANRRMPLSFNCSNLIIDVRPATTFAAGNTANDFYKSAANKFCPGQPGQIVVMRVAYPLPAILPLNLFNRTAGVVNDVPGLSGSYHILMASALFEEENYSGSYAPPAGC